MTPAALLVHLRAAPWAPWLPDARVGLTAGERWLVGMDRVVGWSEEPVDAEIDVEEADLDRMLARAAPEGVVRMRHGTRDRAPRIRQAHAVLMLASLGWCGPWPDPEADAEHDPMLREAILSVAIGPKDGVAALFPAEAPLPPISLRFTDGARPVWVTEGLSAVANGELWATGRQPPLRVMRARALDAIERGHVVEQLEIDGVAHTVRASALPLASKHAWLFRMS